MAISPIQLVLSALGGVVASIVAWVILDQMIGKTGASDPLFTVVKTFVAILALAIVAAGVFVALRMGG